MVTFFDLQARYSYCKDRMKFVESGSQSETPLAQTADPRETFMLVKFRLETGKTH